MSHGRRTNDRRRRVLYSAHQADHYPSTEAGRREVERLREARRPPSAYGSRVHRRLRARWFSLVPVRRRTLIMVAGLLGIVAMFLVGAHYASLAWPWIAYRPEIARPLRLDRPDSFGRWFSAALLAGCSGASLLIYQLRRYRNDDFKGRYRLWRLFLIVMMLASLNSLVSIIDWGGALLDAGFGKRVALTGSDWIRLVVSLGGAVLALRLVAEVRRCRFALCMMLFTCLLMAIPQAARWNVLRVDSIGTWVIVTSAPLLACTTLFISLGGYLRMLYREVRQIEANDSLRERFQQMRLRVFRRRDREDADADPADADPNEPVREGSKARLEDTRPTDPKASKPRAKRRWFGLRRAKPAASDKADGSNKAKSDTRAAKPPAQKRRRFSMRLSPPSDHSDRSEKAAKADLESADTKEPQRRSGWLRRKQKLAEPEAAGQGASGPAPGGSPAARAEPNSEIINPDEIDWSSLSKSERRRLRKQMKRQNRAA